MLKERQAQPVTERLRDWIEQRRSMSERKPRIMENVGEAQARMQAAFSASS